MELEKSLFGLLFTAVRYSFAETPQLRPPPAFGIIYEGDIGHSGLAKICDISL
jgi:hypothetical protein